MRKSYIRLGDLLREWRFSRILFACAGAAFFGLGWPPDLQRRWYMLLPLAIVSLMVGVAYLLARRSERRQSPKLDDPLNLSGPGRE